MSITPWRDRLDWSGERSPDGQAIRKAMEAEIKDLRAVLTTADRTVQAANARADRAVLVANARADRKVQAANARADREIKEARARANEWRQAANRYQKKLLEKLK